ncbi:hypothetical protein D3C71_1239780 [compost metagenome]
MNIEQFEYKVLNLLSTNKRLIKKAGKIDVELLSSGATHTIGAYDGNKRVGFMEYNIDEENKSIWVNMVQVQEEYKGSNVALKLIKKFHNEYKEKYWGWDIRAQFYNYELSDFFEKAVQKGWFPEGVNLTHKVDVSEQENKSFDEWAKESDESNFGVNRKIDLNSLPEPWMRLSDNSRENFFGGDVIYKNLNSNDLNILMKEAEKFYHLAQEMYKILADGVDIYYSFGNISYSDKAISSLNAKLIAYIDDYSQNPEIITTNIDLISQQAENLNNFLGSDLADIFISESEFVSSIQNVKSIGTCSVYNINDLKEKSLQIASIKSRLKKVGGN